MNNNSNQNTTSSNFQNSNDLNINDKTLEDIQAKINEIEAKEKATQSQDFISQLEAKQKEFNELNDKYLRLVAEFDNFKRRTKDDSFRLVNIWSVSILKSILPFFDNFQRAILQCPEEIRNSDWWKGIFAIESNLISELEKKWLSKVKSLGEKFNSNNMEALMQDPLFPKDIVSKVLEDGFEFNWELVRVAKVVVWSQV